MITRSMTVEMKKSNEARPVAFLVQVASQFESSIYIEYDNKKINAKSIMGMMTVNLSEGKEVSVSADGADETEAIDKIQEYLCQS